MGIIIVGMEGGDDDKIANIVRVVEKYYVTDCSSKRMKPNTTL